jgi:hypothetical protein
VRTHSTRHITCCQTDNELGDISSRLSVHESKRLSPSFDEQDARYLDVALKLEVLVPHIEGCTPFITLHIHFFLTAPFHSVFMRKWRNLKKTDNDLWDRYWLPDMLKHEYVTPCFIAQDAYKQAAPNRCRCTLSSDQTSSHMSLHPSACLSGRPRTLGSGKRAGCGHGLRQYNILGGQRRHRHCVCGGKWIVPCAGMGWHGSPVRCVKCYYLSFVAFPSLSFLLCYSRALSFFFFFFLMLCEIITGQ